MTFLPDGRLLVTEQEGRLFVVTQDGEKSAPIAGTPEVDYGGQGGFGDVILHPDYTQNSIVYLSYVEAGDGPVVLLLHGLSDSLLSWYCNIDYLADAGYRVIAPDLPGSGESDKPGTRRRRFPREI